MVEDYLKNQCVKQVQCVNKNELSIRVQMPASSGQYIVMPITFKAGETNQFQLLINTDDKVSLMEVDGTAQAMKAVAKIPDWTPKVNAKQPTGYSMIISPGGGSKQIALPKEVSRSTPSTKEKSQPVASPKSAPPPKEKTTATSSSKPKPKPYTAPKTSQSSSKSTSTSKPAKTHHSSSHSTKTTVDVSKDRKGDIIISFGGGGKSKTTSTVESFYCGGCGASQKKGAKQCTSCGVKLKK